MEVQKLVNHFASIIMELIDLNWDDKRKCIVASNNICKM